MKFVWSALRDVFIIGLCASLSCGQYTCCFYEVDISSTSYPNFNSLNNLQLVGATTSQNGNLILTPNNYWQNGGVWNSIEGPYGFGFTTSFTFSFSNIANNQFGGADGIAFVIQNNSPSALGNSGGGIGYDGIASSIAIEFDTYLNTEAGDLDGNHISVHTRGVQTNSYYEQYSLGQLWNVTPPLKSSTPLQATIQYTSESINQKGLLQVFYEDMKPLSVSVNLDSLLNLSNGTVWLGFTSSTGGGFETTTLYNWNFEALLPATVCTEYFDCPQFPNSTIIGSQSVKHCDDCFD